MDQGRITSAESRRRSRRIALAVPVFVSSHEPAKAFSETCETVWVSTHGCSIRSPKSLDTGDVVRLDIPHSDRSAFARVVQARPVGNTWVIGLELEKAENFWRVRFPPEDWIPPKPTAPLEAPANPPKPTVSAVVASPPTGDTHDSLELARRLQAADSLLRELREMKTQLQVLAGTLTEQIEAHRQEISDLQALREKTAAPFSREILEAELHGLGDQWREAMRQKLADEFGEHRLELYARAGEFFEKKAREVTEQACRTLQARFEDALESVARVLREKLRDS